MTRYVTNAEVYGAGYDIARALLEMQAREG